MQILDLSRIFWSKCRTKILEKFFLDFEIWQNDGFHMRWLSRDLWEQINSVKRELDNLEAIGLLKSRLDQKKKFFSINENFPLTDEFKEIFMKSYNPLNTIKAYFKTIKTLQFVLVNESLGKRMRENTNTAVDILLIGEIDKVDFNNFLSQTFYNKRIKYAIIGKQDFFTRLDYQDKLIINILQQPGNIFLRDDLDIENIMKKYKLS